LELFDGKIIGKGNLEFPDVIQELGQGVLLGWVTFKRGDRL